MQVSFGKKIPIMQCSIKDVEKNKTIPATIYEYDCQSSDDIEDMLYIGRDWYYYLSVACDMQDKYEKENFREEKSPMHFYVMENQNGKTVALCETIETDNEIQVEYIESKHDSEQKYCGKTMLAALGKKTLDNNISKLMIIAALKDVFGFYINGCGFNKVPDTYGKLEMGKEQIQKFISDTEAQTGGKILDINS